MAKKATKTTLFNKNHITITKDSNVKNDYSYVNVRSVYTNDSDYSNRIKKIIRKHRFNLWKFTDCVPLLPFIHVHFPVTGSSCRFKVALFFLKKY